ncbi:class I adenylate-forming enzyme family protein [Novosphingobium sp. JCM 18896]|uniref:class I adenylate-forming enzyme family protein n=1 Tax=Novosphingobium sp. JCM 18896 TaxID=2989731 RepID=UPI00222183B0|nr:class I adenylate-forming enzyme family protein [Novosphingobium sp. JCM 18896]MCW1432294.1 acyl--CoA ligase [Novosphingobium sp. JCM 18896]
MLSKFYIEATTLGDLLARAAGLAPSRYALVLPDEQITYDELFSRAQRISRSLIALELPQGAHVGLMAPNSIAYVSALFGVAMAGCVAVPINVRHKATELAYIIRNADLSAILTSRAAEDPLDFLPLLEEALPSLSRSSGGQDLALNEAPLLRTVALLRGSEAPTAMSVEDFDALAETVLETQVAERRRRVRIRDVALLIYTSGTTANPKGCMLTHEACVRGPYERMRERFWAGEHSVTWSGGPLFHIGSLGPFIGSISVAGTFLTDLYYEPGRALALMAAYGATVAWPWFPAIIHGLIDHPDFEAATLDTLRFVNVIGPPDLITRLQNLLPHAEVIQSCGMTETAGIFAIADAGDPLEVRVASNGKAAPGVEIKIVDPVAGETVPDGDLGEIWVRGFCVMEGYWRDPTKTAEALTPDGWLRTGDLYKRRPDGNVVFCGRLKDMLKVGGENVATAELEAYLCSHPEIRFAEVIGRPDPRLDEVPVAFVELYPESALSSEDIVAFCRGRIASYKVPREIFIMSPGDWPMSLTKVDKRALRERLAALT